MKTVPLTKGLVALVDDADFEKVSSLNWCAQKSGRVFYAVRGFRHPGGQTKQYLHQFLMPGVGRVDHKDGDGLNNCRSNLRASSSQRNSWSFQRKSAGATSCFRGVFWDAPRAKWSASITVNYKKVFLGRFREAEEAAHAYDAAARKYFGEFASPNFGSAG